jgi:hypothetical protein
MILACAPNEHGWETSAGLGKALDSFEDDSNKYNLVKLTIVFCSLFSDSTITLLIRSHSSAAGRICKAKTNDAWYPKRFNTDGYEFR